MTPTITIRIAQLKQLQSLALVGAVGGFGDNFQSRWGGLGELKQLRELQIAGRIPELARTELPRLRGLARLDLAAAWMTDTELRSIAPLTQLRWLSLPLYSTSNKGLKELAGMTGLRHVEINGNTPLPAPQVSDEGLKYLAGLR